MKNWKQSTVIGIVAIIVLVFAITACDNGGEDDESDTNSSQTGGNNSNGNNGGTSGTPSNPNTPSSTPGNPVTPNNPGTPITPPINQTPVATDYFIQNTFQYENSVTAVTITPLAGKSTGAVTIFYNGSTTLPAMVGTYTITFNVAAASGWNAASGLAGGTLTINSLAQPENQNPTAADYTVSGTGTYTYNGSARIVTITPKEGKSAGTVTVLYNGSQTAPLDADSYTITFNVAAVSGWNAAPGLAGGTLTINKASGGNVSTPTLNTKTNNSITINAVTVPVTGQSVEYGISTTNNANTATWQPLLTTFNGLNAGTTYYIFARAIGNNNYETGAASSGLSVMTTNQQTTPQGRIEYFWVNEHGDLVTTSNGATTVARGSTLTITAQGTGYVVKQWHLNGVNTGQSGNTYSFSSTTAGKHTVGLFVEKDGRLYNTNIIITVQ